jgi:hypothetical protein
VLVRGIGPSLPLDGKLADPTLELVDERRSIKAGGQSSFSV